jgi:hypothetical protein
MRARLLATFVLIAGCGAPMPGASAPDELDDSADERALASLALPSDVINMGQLVYGEQVPLAGNATVRFAPGEKHGYPIVGRANDWLTINGAMYTPGSWVSPTWSLYGPAAADGSFGPMPVISSTTTPVRYVLPANGQYLLVISHPGLNIPALYTVSSGCGTPAGSLTPSICRPNMGTPMSFGRTRITQAAIDRGRYTPAQLFDIGDFLFNHPFTVAEGWGNGLAGLSPGGANAAPNLRPVHKGRFGGPDSNTCSRCHLQGGTDGAGDTAVNMLQDGDGVTVSSALARNPRQVIGVGYLELLGLEMTHDLQAQLAAAQAAQLASGQAQTVALKSKGVAFGSLTVRADGTVDTTAVQGIDADLVVKPLGWKGRVATNRRFVEGGFQVHLGMQTEPLVAAHCLVAMPDAVGSGPDCADPDADGIKSELTEGQLTAAAVYVSLQQVPVRLPAADLRAQARIEGGALLFQQIGCASCHVPKLILNDATHVERPDLTGGPGVTFDLTVAGKLPQLAYNSDGVIEVELYSDLKRHDMGAMLTDSHATFGVIPANLFMTPPLWGVASSGPYLHDGRTFYSGSSGLYNAIYQHAGEGAAARTAFLALPNSNAAPNDQQNWVLEFLMSLGRDPAHIND